MVGTTAGLVQDGPGPAARAKAVSMMASPHEAQLVLFFTLAVFVAAAIVVVATAFITAPYGRHTRPGWGGPISSRTGWIVMETPAALGFATAYAFGSRAGDPVPLVMAAFWETHYLYRAYVYPRRAYPRGSSPSIAVGVVLMGFLFNSINAYTNGRWVAELGPVRGEDWLRDPRFVLGTILFFGGLGLNRWSDAALRQLRRAGNGYVVPTGGAFEWISCPNYLGEIVQWLGWALLTWSLPALGFAVFTAANLGPRAIAHHRWYRKTFPEYPRHRRALIPYLL